MNEPLWRKVLCWGALGCFFLMPGTAFALVIYDALTAGSFLRAEDINNLKAFGTYQATLTGLLFGLAGLNTFDRYNGGGANGRRKVRAQHPDVETGGAATGAETHRNRGSAGD